MNTAFWKAAAERAIKTFAQAALALLGTGSVGITSLDWRVIASVAATAAVASLLTSLASLSSITPGASVAPAEAPAALPQTVTVPDVAPAATFPAAKVAAAEAAVTVPDPVIAEPAPVAPVFEAPAEVPAAPVA